MTDIRISPELQSQLCQLAFATFTSKPGEGASLEGPLFGVATAAAVSVSGWGQDAANTKDTVGQWRIDRNLRQPRPFTTPGVCLLVAPVSAQTADALIWRRTAGGADSPTRRETFRGETRVPKRTIPLPKPVVAARRDWTPIAWMAMLFLLTASAGWLWPAIAEADAPPHPRLTLAVQPSGRDLHVHWRESGGTGRIESALLTVREGRDELSVDLLDRYRPTGEIIVHSRGREVVVSLRVRRHGQSSATQTVTYVEPLVAKTPSAPKRVSPGA